MATYTTPKGRFSFPHLFERNSAGKFPSNKYETVFMIPKNQDISEMKNACEALLKEKSPKSKGIEFLKHPPIRDGDADGDGKYAGHWFMKFKSDHKPRIVGADPKVDLEDKDELYGGQYGRVSYNPYFYDVPSVGIGLGLKNVQVLSGGERFGGGGSSPESDFGAAIEEDLNDSIPF